MEHGKENIVCDWCGRHKDGRYKWLRLLLAVLIGVFIFLAGVQIGELRQEVYGGTMRWHDGGGEMMMDNQFISPAPTPVTGATQAAPAVTGTSVTR